MPVFSKMRLACCLAVVVVFAHGSLAKADKKATLDAIVRVWKKRQQETTSFRFDWIEKQFIPKDQVPVPLREDARFDYKASVIISDARMSTTSEGPLWHVDRFIPQLYRSVWDGTSSKSFTAEISEALHPHGEINSIKRNQDADSNFCTPILLTFRAFHPVMGRFAEDKLQVLDERVVIRDRGCICVEQKKSNYAARGWVDPVRDYVVVRYAMVFDGFPAWHSDIEYRLDNQFGWVPESWHDVLMNTNTTPVSLSEDRIAQVKSFEINGAVEDREFQLEFPPKTEVIDWIKDQWGVVLDDGTQRMATPEEIKRGITYEQMLRFGGKTRSKSLLAAVSIVGFGVVLGLLLLIARKRRRKST